MEIPFKKLGNVFIYLFTQKSNALTGFKVPQVVTISENKIGSSPNLSFKISGSKIQNFLGNVQLLERKIKIRIILIPKNENLKIECPIEVARLVINFNQKNQPQRIFDDFREIDSPEQEKPEDVIKQLNRTMASMVSACLLSPFLGFNRVGTGKKEKMVSRRFWVKFRIDDSEAGPRKSSKDEKSGLQKSENDRIIILNPESEKFKMRLMKEAQRMEDINNTDGSQRDFTKKESVSQDEQEFGDCSRVSQDWTDGDYEQLFLGKTHQLEWQIEALDANVHLSLQIHENLNSICSFISKIILDEKSCKGKNRKRFWSQDTSNEKKTIRKKTFYHNRNSSALFMHSNVDVARKNTPFKLLRDQIIVDCLSKRKNRNSNLTEFKNSSNVEVNIREDKFGVAGLYSDSRWSVNSKKAEVISCLTFSDLESKGSSLKRIFQISKFLKKEMFAELRSNRKRIRFSGKSLKAKKKDAVPSNYYSHTNDKKKSAERFYSKERKKESLSGGSDNKAFVVRATPKGNDYEDFGIHEENEGKDEDEWAAPFPDNSQLYTLIKFKNSL